MSTYSLLPNNSSPLEHGLELAFSQLLSEIPVPYPALLKPNETPKAMLPYLARDLGVLTWDATAAEQEQRQTLSNIWRLRRLAGTRRGLALALDALEYDAEITPWFAMVPVGTPYTFEIVAWKRQNAAVNQAVVQSLLEHLNAAKSARDSYQLALAFALETRLSMATVASRSLLVFDQCYQGQISASPSVSAALQVAGVHKQIILADHSEASSLPDFSACSGSVFLGSALRILLFTELTPESKL